MDRCALFVDAGYVLADGAMAVHGTRRSESVSWDHEGLLQLLSSLARERSGLPVLRCYWYEATVDGRRTAEQDALADVPGIKLRLAKIRPGRREGVETEIHRDLTTLARNSAISDALVVSAEEDLAQVIADVQDLGMRVTLVHIAVDGNWTISRALRQESDDIIEVSGDHLRPYVELIAGAEPAHADEEGDLAAARPLANGHSTAPAASYQVPPVSGSHAPPSIYTAPVVAEYQRPALQLPRAAQRDDRAHDTRDDRARDTRATGPAHPRHRAREDRAAPPAVNGDAPAARQDIPPRQDIAQRQEIPSRQDIPGRPDIYAASAASTRNRPEPAPQNPAARARAAETRAAETRAAETRTVEDPAAYAPGTGQVSQGAPDTARNPPRPPPASSAACRPRGAPPARCSPARWASPPASMPPRARATSPRSRARARYGARRSAGRSRWPARLSRPATRTRPARRTRPAASPSPTPCSRPTRKARSSASSVAREAPALWLEAVLARKPRMPSDLEARLLQGSALPIDFLLHDEVRHALRRGFWDALERTRR